MVTRAHALTAADRAVLDLACSNVRAGDMANRIHDLGMTEVAYYSKLNELLDTEAALAAYPGPGQVPRLRRLRAERMSLMLGAGDLS